MSPTTITPSVHRASHCITPPADAIERHESRVQKNRRSASTGSGRAWSEDEEVYLLQTRLQKIPYKHIAAHLKKTELACRLHYHQLSHGNNRRKLTTSVSSSSSAHSPNMHTSSIPSPIRETASQLGSSPGSPASYTSYSSETQPVRLLSAASLFPRSGSSSPQRPVAHPIAILPKPTEPCHSASSTPPLRLDCDVVQATHSLPHYFFNINLGMVIDHARLTLIYNSHRGAFWSAIAAEYGHGITAHQIEDVWRRSLQSPSAFTAAAPPTPCVSPADNYRAASVGSVYQRAGEKEGRTNATSIRALLGIDASPRSLKERELIKQIEERGKSLCEAMVEGI